MAQNLAEQQTQSTARHTRDGLFSALIAYLVWGFLPLYFIVVKTVPALEVLAHRVIWAVPFGALIIHLRRQWPDIKLACTHRVTMMYLLATSLLIGVNWLVYIWAVQLGQIFQASLGYYITPILFAGIGVLLFGERLRSPQIAAVILAAIGVSVLTFSGGQFPTIALVLAATFTAYGVLRKKVVVGAMPGLFVETVLLLPFALLYLMWLFSTDTAVFGGDNLRVSLILLLAGPLTVVPLLFFAIAAKRLSLATIGMMQFIGPSIQFMVGLYSGEQLTVAHLICFSCIWGAVVLFSFDAWRANRVAA